MTRLSAAGRVTFSALSVPNYRRYVSGQAVSLTGTWMQMTAQSWLVLTLTDSSTALGFVVALQTLPVLLLAPYGGVIADRVNPLDDRDRAGIAHPEALARHTAKIAFAGGRAIKNGVADDDRGSGVSFLASSGG